MRNKKYLLLFLRMAKAAFGVAAASSAFAEGHPVLTVVLMALAAAASEAITYLDNKDFNNNEAIN